MRKILLLIITVIITTLMVYAAEWEELGANVYLDLSSIRWEGNQVFFLIKSLNKGLGKNHKPINGEKVYYEIINLGIDCSNKKANIIESVLYGKNDSVLKTNDFKVLYDVTDEWEDIPSDTNVEIYYELFCEQR